MPRNTDHPNHPRRSGRTTRLLAASLAALTLGGVLASLPSAPTGADELDAHVQATTVQTLTTADSEVTAGVNNQGWWSPDMDNDNWNDNYFVGACASACNGWGTQHNNFFTFDVSSLQGTVVSATLKLQRFTGNGDPTEQYGLFGVSTHYVPLNENAGTSQAIYDDLGSGPSFGTFDVSTSGDPSDVLSFPLNARGIQGLETQRAGAGMFAVGGSLLSQGSGEDFLFGWSGAAAQSLEVVTTSAPQAQKANSAAAWDGANTLVVWNDSRNGDDDIYGARISPSGVVLDPGGFPISRSAGDQQLPTVAWNGSTYFVSWQDRRSGRDFDIYGTRVSASKTVSNPAGVRLTSAQRDQTAPWVAAKGTSFLVVWQDGRNNVVGGRQDNTDVYGARVSGSGTVADPGGFAISTATRRQLKPNVTSNGTDWLVAWTDRRPGGQADIYSTRITAAGTVVNPSGVALTRALRDQSEPQLAWNGSTYLVIWSDYRSDTSLDVYGTRVSSAGAALDPQGLAISTGPGSQSSAALTANGSQFLASWNDSRSGAADVYAGRIASSGARLDGNGFLVSGALQDQLVPALARNGSGYLAAWDDLRNPAVSRIFGTRITTGAAVLSPSGTSISG